MDVTVLESKIEIPEEFLNGYEDNLFELSHCVHEVVDTLIQNYFHKKLSKKGNSEIKITTSWYGISSMI